MFARLPIHPDGKAEDLARLLIDDNSRVAAPILFLRQAAKFTHIHDDLSRFPTLPAIPAATEPDVDIFL